MTSNSDGANDSLATPPFLSELSHLLDRVGTRLYDAVHQSKPFSISLSQHIFSLYQQLSTIYITERAVKGAAAAAMENDPSVSALLQRLTAGAELLLQLIDASDVVERANDRQHAYIFERETPQQVDLIRSAIDDIRTAAHAIDASQWRHYAGSSDDHVPLSDAMSHKAEERKRRKQSRRRLEIHANVFASEECTRTGVQRPEEHCFQPHTFHLIGNEHMFGRDLQFRKTIYQLKNGTESALRMVMCVGSLGIGKTNFAVRMSRTIVREFDANQTFFVRCRSNQEYPQTTTEIMQQIVKLWHVGTMPSKMEELRNLYHKSFHGRRTVLLLDDPADVKQVLELLPRFDNKSDSFCVVVVASRNSLAIETFTRGQVDIVDEQNQIIEKKGREEGYGADDDSEYLSDEEEEEEEDDDDDDDELQPADDSDLTVDRQINAARQKGLELKKEMAQIFGTYKRRVVTVTLHEDNIQKGKPVKHPKNFDVVIVRLEKVEMDDGAEIFSSAHPGITTENARPLTLLCENIPVFLKVAARTHLLFLSQEMSFDKFITYISESIDDAGNQDFSHLKTLCHGYFIGCFKKWDTALQNLLLGMTVFPASFDVVSCSKILGIPLSRTLEVIQEMSRMGLVSVESYPQRYCLHDLVRETFCQYVQENEYDLEEEQLTALDQCRNRFVEWYSSRMKVYDREHEFGGVGSMPGQELYDLDLENTKMMLHTMQESETDHIKAINAMRHLLRDHTFPIQRGILYQRLVPHADELESDFEKATFLEGFAQVYKQLTDYDQAYQKCKQALDIMSNAVILSDNDEDELELLPILKQLGDLASSTKSFEYARGNYEKIIQLTTKHAKDWQKIDMDTLSETDVDLGEIAGLDDNEHIIVDPFLAHALTQMAVIHLTEGEFKKGRKCFDRGITIMKRIYGPIHPVLSEAYASYANVLKSFKGRAMFDEINQLFQDALKIDNMLYGENSFVQVQRMEDFGVSLLAQGRYTESEEVFRRTIDMRRHQYGERDITVSAGMNNLAVALKNMGKLEEAEDMYEQCLVILTDALGDEHPQTSVTKSNLATLRTMIGKGASAEQLYQEAMDSLNRGNEEHAGNGSPVTNNNDEVKAAMLNQMGDTMRQQEEYDQAISYYEQALELRRKISKDPENDPEIAKIVSSVGKLYFDRGEFAEAERLQTEAALIMEKQVGKEHVQYVACIMSLANSKFRLNKPKEAEALFREAYEIKRDKLREGELQLLSVKQSIAVCVDMQKRYQESEKEYRELLQQIEQLKVGDDKLRIVLLSLATNMSRQQRFDEAEQFYRRAENLVLEEYGEDSLPYGDLMMNTAAVLLNKNSYDAAERCFSKALVIFEEHLGPDSDKTAMVQENLNELRNLIYQRDRAKRCCIIM